MAAFLDREAGRQKPGVENMLETCADAFSRMNSLDIRVGRPAKYRDRSTSEVLTPRRRQFGHAKSTLKRGSQIARTVDRR